MGVDGRKYPESEVADIVERARTIRADNGLELEMRPVPGDTREHVLDPRVYARAHAKLAASRGEQKMTGDSGSSDIDGVIAFRTAPNKETHVVRGADVVKRTMTVVLGEHEVEVHVFTPSGHEPSSQLLIFYHGGGFVAGNIGQYENDLRYICDVAGCVAIYPEYRLAPETAFPGGLEDCLGVYDWAVEHAAELGVDPQRIAIAGDSAGGSLSNAVVLQRGREGRIKLLVEMYPLVDGGPVPDEWSHELYPALGGQEPEASSRVDRILLMNDDLSRNYTGGNAGLLKDERVSALYADDVSMFPRTLVVSSEFDYLRYQDELFAKKLHDAGVDVRAIRYGGCDHGFFETCGVMPQAEDLCLVISEEIEKI